MEIRSRLKVRTGLAVLLFAGMAAGVAYAATKSSCAECAAWNAPHKPFRIFADTYYVGTDQLSSVLITSDFGHVLIDGGLPESAAVIKANIEALGFSLGLYCEQAHLGEHRLRQSAETAVALG